MKKEGLNPAIESILSARRSYGVAGIAAPNGANVE